jgi:hypothetical protein
VTSFLFCIVIVRESEAHFFVALAACPVNIQCIKFYADRLSISFHSLFCKSVRVMGHFFWPRVTLGEVGLGQGGVAQDWLFVSEGTLFL